MLLHKNKNGTLFKSAVMVVLIFTTCACNTVDISYINRETIKTSAFAAHKPHYAVGDSKPMQLGALRLTDKDAKEGEAGRIVILQRKRGVYMAETMINTDSTKHRYFFSVGIDPRNRTPALGFRMEF